MHDSLDDGLPGSLPLKNLAIGLDRSSDSQTQPAQASRTRCYGQEVPAMQYAHSQTSSHFVAPNPLHHGYDHLDDFDRRLLGLTPQSIPYAPHAGSPHISLPTDQSSRRVLGDASHYFRPFATQLQTYRPTFASTPSSLPPGSSSTSQQSQVIVQRAANIQFRNTPPWDRPKAPTKCPCKQGECKAHSSKDPLVYPSRTASPMHSARWNAQDSSPYQSSDRPSPLLETPEAEQQIGGQAQPQHADYSWPDRRKPPTLLVNKDPPLINETRLISPRQALPNSFHSVFPYELFNVIQSKVFPIVYGTNDNLVVSAPTGSGKTAILEMAICKLVGSPGGENFKIVYQAPAKSLCAERVKDWEAKFRHMGLKCAELTGDTSQVQARRVGDASIIVTTPEKWDSVTRKWSDHRKLLELVRLVLIDEVHILKDIRGATLEAVVSRMKTIGAQVRFVALSATVPNIHDVALWLGLNCWNQVLPAKFEAFGEDLRPVQLQKFVYGFTGHGNDYQFDKILEPKLPSLLAKHSENKPIMVFCLTRKSCEATARNLAEWWSTCSSENKAWPAPKRAVKILSQDLQELLPYGVAYHHAGMDAQDRAAVETGFRQGDLFVICCTSTLAVGVNLPCHTVVLKGTTGYLNNEPQEYSDLEVMQMLGRAGRPQYDDSAVGVIMTRKENVSRYSAMVSGKQVLESKLHLNLLEHLNSEVGLGTIKDCETAQAWVNGTFLSVRMRQAPQHYGASGIHTPQEADALMQEWCQRDITLLQQNGLITADTPFRCTDYGGAMARYMIGFETMRTILAITRGAGMEDILTELCHAEDFKEFRMKPAERGFFRAINVGGYARYPIKKNLTETWHKVSLLIQFYLGASEWPNDRDTASLKRQLSVEKVIIFDRLNRLVQCLIDCKAADGDGMGTRSAFELARSLSAGSWDGLPCQLTQIPGFGPVAVRKWNCHGIKTVNAIADMDFQQIERLASRNPPYGRTLLKTLANFPRLHLDVTLQEPKLSHEPQEIIVVTINAHVRHTTPNKSPNWNGEIPAVTLLVVTSDGNLADVWRGNISKIDHRDGLRLKFTAPLRYPDQEVTCFFSCEEIVGTEVLVTLRSQLPVSVFKSQAPPPSSRNPNSKRIEFDFDDIPDEDMMAALDAPVCVHNRELHAEQNDYRVEASSDSRAVGGFPFVEENRETYEPKKMSNGKWMCNHACRDNGLTKSGKPCSHKCCIEGLDQPRAPPQVKKAKQASKKGSVQRTESGSQDSNFIRSPAIDRSMASTISSVVMEPRDRKRPSQNQDEFTKSKVPRTDNCSGFDLVDLSTLSEDELCGVAEGGTKKITTSAESERQKISELRQKISGRDQDSPHLTNSYRADHSIRKTLQNTQTPVSQSTKADITPKSHMWDDTSDASEDEYFPDIEDILKATRNPDAFVSAVEAARPDDSSSSIGRVEKLPDELHEQRLSRSPSVIMEDALTQEPAICSNIAAVASHPPEQYCSETPSKSKLAGLGEDSPLFFGDPFKVGVHEDTNLIMGQPSNNEPAWVATMDPKLIDSLRGVVNFVD